MFITFEGIDGSGKTTQAEMLYDALMKKGVDVVLTHEPFRFGPAIKAMKDKTGRTAYLTFMADRSWHYDDVIAPALKRNVWVICDRYIDSTEVYQKKFESAVGGWLKPDLTILIDIDPVEAYNRMVKIGGMDDFDKETLIKGANRQSDYLRIAEREKGRFFVVYGGIDEDKIHEKIMKEILK